MVALLLAFLLNYFFLLPIGFKAGFLFLYACCLLAMVFVYCYMSDVEDIEIGKRLMVFNGILVIWCVGILLLGGFLSSPVVDAASYRDCISVEEHSQEILAESIPDLEQIEKISLMDTASAEKLGDRQLGSLTDLVSQFCVGEYYTICIKGDVYKIAPLEYNGFFKWVNNDSIPGYVLVNPITNEAEYVELEKSIRYSPSGYFGNDLDRKFYSEYKSTYWGDYSFQVDDEGNPYWVRTIMEPRNLWGNKTPKGVAVMDASTGFITKYSFDSAPEWVDLCISGDMVESLYNRHGAYTNGFWNSMFSQVGVTQTTDDFGYLTKDNDVYIYTGITSVSSDESNLGVLLVNTRTCQFDYYPIPGAEEYSAMGAAEGIVQNFGYASSFPSLVMVEEEPTYVMVLKDSNGLVKQYAMVNYKNYTIAVVADTLSDCTSKYIKSLAGEVEISASEGNLIVSKVEFVTLDGNTYCFIVDTDGNIYKAEFAPNQLLIEIGNEISKDGYSIQK